MVGGYIDSDGSVTCVEGHYNIKLTQQNPQSSSWYCHLAVFPCFLSLCTYGRSKIKLYRKEKSYCIKQNCQMAVLSLPRRYPSLNCLFNNLKKSSICHTSTIPVSPNCQMDIFPMVSFGRLYQLFSATVFFIQSLAWTYPAK